MFVRARYTLYILCVYVYIRAYFRISMCTQLSTKHSASPLRFVVTHYAHIIRPAEGAEILALSLSPLLSNSLAHTAAVRAYNVYACLCEYGAYAGLCLRQQNTYTSSQPQKQRVHKYV